MKIFIDAGHNYSGADTGACGNGLREQDISYYISQRIGGKLIKCGLDVKYSRNNLTDNIGTTVSESINGRARMANDWRADYFISIHCNASNDPSANGTETLIFSKGGNADKLAQNVTMRLFNIGLRNRGVKVRTDLGVLKYTNMPAILVETAFITNAADCKYLTDRQNETAEAITRGICEHLGIGYYEEDEHMAKVVFIGSGKNMRLEVDGKEADGSMLVETNGNTLALSAADLLREIGHEVSWRE